jgi:hypothetical protein
MTGPVYQRFTRAKTGLNIFTAGEKKRIIITLFRPGRGVKPASKSK